MAAARDKRGPAVLRRWVLFAAAAALTLAAVPASATAAGPAISATWASEVTATSFRANAIVETANLTTTYRFDYLTLAAYEANLAAGREGFAGASRMPIGAEAKVFAATTPQEAFQRVAGLSADTAYRYRIVARNSGGEAIGPLRAVRTQESSPDFSLPEGRGWEMVSPIDKNGGSISAPESVFGGGDFQAAAGGGSVTYAAAASFAGGAGFPGASQYVSTRGGSGWSTENVTRPTEAGGFGPEPSGAPFRLFSADLTRALALTAPSEFALLAMPGATPLATFAGPDARFAGATADLSHLVFSTCAALTPEATEVPGGEGGCDPAFPNLYELSPGSGPQLLNLEPGATQGTPGAELAAQSGAISADGSRVYWTDSAGALFVRNGSHSLEVAPEGAFQVASADGSVAYYTSGGHLYRYSLASESATDLTPAGGVVGVLGAAADGSCVYFLDGGGLELWRGGAVTTVAAAASPSSYPPATGTARVSADGTKLAFLADVPLAGYDSNGQDELYRYDASASSLLCVSCNPTGARPLGPTSIPGAVANGAEVRSYKPRVMTDGGSRIFFDTLDALVPKDTNGEQDVYEWRAPGVGGCGRSEGCVGLISSGKGAEASTFLDASADGADAFFLAPDSLVGADPGSVDVYDTRIGGGFPEPTSPIPCFGDACQPLPPEPEDPTPGTAFYGSERNPKLVITRAGKQGKKGGQRGKGHRAGHRHKGHRHGKHHRARGRGR